MPPKQTSGFEFCGACEVPEVCPSPMALLTARAAISSMLKGYESQVRNDLLHECQYDNVQVAAILHCASMNANGSCKRLYPVQTQS